jgi:isopenicillin N synthase-like dioxygenase
VDLSWITLLLQDDVGGLEVRTVEGEWIPVEPVPGTLVVNIGEILQFVSGGLYAATPHRVVNPSRDRSRISIPFFLNPALDSRIEPWPCPTSCLTVDPEHVHRVFDVNRREPFLFGEEEWKRKGMNVWCKDCVQPPVRV